MNAGLRDLREIRAPWGRREAKGILAAPAQRAIKVIQALWGRKVFPARLAREAPEEIQGL